MTLAMSVELPGAGMSVTLRAEWDQQSPRISARLDLVEHFVVAALHGDVEADLQSRARQAARELAGSLDAFGLTAAAGLADQLVATVETAGATTDEVLQLSELVVELRAELDGRPSGLATLPALEMTESGTASAEPPVILVVGTDGQLLDRLAAAAAAAGFQAVTASSGDAARAELGGRGPSAVLVDVPSPRVASSLQSLHGLNGSEVGVPTLLLSESTDVAHRIAAIRSGVSGFLDRRVPAPELMDVVRNQVRPMLNANCSVVVLDGDPAVLEAVSGSLTRTGLRVGSTADPQELFEVLGEQRPDLVLLGSGLAGVDAVDLCKVLRTDARWFSLPVLLLTDADASQAATQVLESGADGHVRRPVRPEELLTTVARAFQRVRAVQQMADTDALCGVWNRRRAVGILQQYLRAARDADRSLSLAVLDIDHFKHVNDRFGHLAGDEVLRGLGGLMNRMFRGEDVIARWDGGEFVLGMYGASRADAVRRVSELQKVVRRLGFTGEGGELFTVNLRAGVAQYPDDGEDLATLVRRADEALDRAKDEGREHVAADGDNRSPAGLSGGVDVDVVLVEEDDVLAEMVLHGLRTQGLSTWRLRNGQEAVEELTGRVRARVVLLDRDLPGLNGLAVLRHLGDAGILRDTRVIMLAAGASEAEVLQTFERGAADHVLKPFSVPVLLQRTRRALRA